MRTIYGFKKNNKYKLTYYDHAGKVKPSRFGNKLIGFIMKHGVKNIETNFNNMTVVKPQDIVTKKQLDLYFDIINKYICLDQKVLNQISEGKLIWHDFQPINSESFCQEYLLGMQHMIDSSFKWFNLRFPAHAYSYIIDLDQKALNAYEVINGKARNQRTNRLMYTCPLNKLVFFE